MGRTKSRKEPNLRVAETLLQRKVAADRAFVQATADTKRKTDERLLPGSATWRRWIAARSAR